MPLKFDFAFFYGMGQSIPRYLLLVNHLLLHAW